VTAFGNDDAADWARGLQQATQPYEFLEQVFDIAMRTDYLQALDGRQVVAAAAVVAAANGRAPTGLPPVLAEWIRGKESALKVLAPAASAALQRVRVGKSGLKDLWQETDNFSDWCNYLDEIDIALTRSLKREWSPEPLNLLSPEVINQVGKALQEGMLFGLRTLYDAPEACAFSDLEAYLSSVRECVPGDEFILWSVEDLSRQGQLLLRKQAEEVSQAELDHIYTWLNSNPMHEFVAAGRHHVDTPAEWAWGDYDSFDQLRELAERCAPAGEFAVLSLTDLLSPGGFWFPRLHLIDAMRPNERGEVPVWRTL
jgi:hypothetical protein